MAKLTLNDILRDKDSASPIWVLNKTKVPNRGPIIFNATKIGGQGLDTVRIEDTWLPIDLSAQLPREQILNSPEFRSCIRSGMMVFIDTEEAEALLAKPGADEERARINERSARLAGLSAESFGEAGPDVPKDDGVMPQVKAIVARLEETGDEVAAINSLRTIDESFKKRDRKHIKEFAKKRGLRKLGSYVSNLKS